MWKSRKKVSRCKPNEAGDTRYDTMMVTWGDMDISQETEAFLTFLTFLNCKHTTSLWILRQCYWEFRRYKCGSLNNKPTISWWFIQPMGDFGDGLLLGLRNNWSIVKFGFIVNHPEMVMVFTITDAKQLGWNWVNLSPSRSLGQRRDPDVLVGKEVPRLQSRQFPIYPLVKITIFKYL